MSAAKKIDTASEDAVTRVYEAGYHIIPTVKDEDVEKIVSEIRSEIEKIGGSFIAEGAPTMTKLAYVMEKREGERYVAYDRAYFGWIKFESATSGAAELTAFLNGNAQILRSMVFKTVREDTRAKIKAPLREVKRTDTIKSATKTEKEEAGPVSEADLEKALETLTQD